MTDGWSRPLYFCFNGRSLPAVAHILITLFLALVRFSTPIRLMMGEVRLPRWMIRSSLPEGVRGSTGTALLPQLLALQSLQLADVTDPPATINPIFSALFAMLNH